MPTEIINSIITVPDGIIGNAAINSAAGIESSKLESRADQIFPVLLVNAKTWDAFHTNIPGTAANDDLGLITGTLGTNALRLQTGDLKAAGSTTRYAGFVASVPQNYHDGQSFVIRVRGGMVTTAADVAATVDLQVYKFDKSGAVGSDLCQTSSGTINSLTKANVDFTIDSTAIDPSDILVFRIAVLVNDAATATAVIGEISNIEIRCTTRG